ncbi:hypothetical protein HPB51_028276 [Rhipicephalus microplus]|uniref:Uncharacterized protein n=1 Tax=Rhipicephalus microplus TaxID=6941 RepID=A0A9J6CXD4_RHIMP|nr:hypothetical protein HPB51_028276 [Rhipicephalus microplus]
MEGSGSLRRAPRRHPASTAATPHHWVRPSPMQGGYEAFEPSTGTEERQVTVIPFVLEPSETRSTCFREGLIVAYWETPRELGGKELTTGPPSIQMTSSRTSPPSWLAEGSRPADDDCCHHEHGQRYLWALVAAGQHAHPSVMSGSGGRVVLVFTTLTFATAFVYFLVMGNMGRQPWTTGAASQPRTPRCTRLDPHGLPMVLSVKAEDDAAATSYPGTVRRVTSKSSASLMLAAVALRSWWAPGDGNQHHRVLSDVGAESPALHRG